MSFPFVELHRWLSSSSNNPCPFDHETNLNETELDKVINRVKEKRELRASNEKDKEISLEAFLTFHKQESKSKNYSPFKETILFLLSSQSKQPYYVEKSLQLFERLLKNNLKVALSFYHRELNSKSTHYFKFSSLVIDYYKKQTAFFCDNVLITLNYFDLLQEHVYKPELLIALLLNLLENPKFEPSQFGPLSQCLLFCDMNAPKDTTRIFFYRFLDEYEMTRNLLKTARESQPASKDASSNKETNPSNNLNLSREILLNKAGYDYFPQTLLTQALLYLYQFEDYIVSTFVANLINNKQIEIARLCIIISYISKEKPELIKILANTISISSILDIKESKNKTVYFCRFLDSLQLNSKMKMRLLDICLVLIPTRRNRRSL